jgi:plasmid stabilization system protein ParE
MQVELDDKFKRNFQTILEYIAKDKITASKNLKKELFKQIKNIPNFPYKYRKSFYFEDENVRDIIFKGYTVVYEVNINKGLIVVLDIFNQNKR